MATLSKICESCGRSFDYRKKWAKNWEQIKYCSDECRRNKNKFDYQPAILEKLTSLKPGSILSPSDVLSPELRNDSDHEEHVRRSLRLLAERGEIEILKRGRVIDASEMVGDVQFRKLRR